MTGEEITDDFVVPESAAMKPNYVSDINRDLGFGDRVARETRLRFLNRDGTFNVKRRGLKRVSFLNLYHILLTMSWVQFLLLVLVLYFLSNIVFGLIYASLGDGSLMDTSEMPTQSIFIRSFFFSVQTFATIGYGTIHPVGLLPNFLVAVESYYSLLANALITGVVFARFSRPTAKIKFSTNAVVAPYRGSTGLMFRIVNNRNSQLINLQMQVLLALFVEENGELVRRFHQLKLEREDVNFLPLSWTIVHPIDEKSPLYNLTEKDLEESDAEILIVLSAIDESFAQTVHTRTSYKSGEVKFGYKFSNLYNEVQPGEPITIDVRKLSLIEKT